MEIISRVKGFSWVFRAIWAGVILLALVGLAARVQAEGLTNPRVPADNRAIALQFAEAGWGTNPDWPAVWDSFMTQDVVYHFNSTATPVVGLEPNKAFNANLFRGFPELKQTVDDVVVEGDRVVYRATLQGKNAGEFLGIPPTGRSVTISGVTWLRIADSKIAEWWYDCNLLEVMQQLGVVSD